MSPTHDGGPAFPIQAYTRPNGDFGWGADGMTLRDYFAAKALPAVLGASSDRDGCYDYDAAAVGAYQVADAMLEARK